MRFTFVSGSALVAAALVLAAFVPMEAAAQEGHSPDWNLAPDTLEGGLGLHYGKVGGNGLSFRLPLKWWLYFQASGGLWNTKDKKQNNFGLELNYILRQDHRTRLLIAGGGARFYKNEVTGSDSSGDIWTSESHWNVGGGVGFEYLQGKRWSWMLEADFVHDGKTEETKVTLQAGLYYYW